MPKTTEEKEAEQRVFLRGCRIANYRVKSASGFACVECGAQGGVLVVRNGETWEGRCRLHREGMPVAVGQMAEVEADVDAAGGSKNRRR